MRILIVDDEKIICDGLKKLIEYIRLPEITEIRAAYDPLEAIKISHEFHPDILVTDIKMPNISGLELLKRVKKTFPLIHSIVLSGYDDYEFIREAFKQKAIDYLLKPATREELQQTLQNTIEQITLCRQTKQQEEKENWNLVRSLLDTSLTWITGNIKPSREILIHLSEVFEEHTGSSFFCYAFLESREPLSEQLVTEFIHSRKDPDDNSHWVIKQLNPSEFLILLCGTRMEHLEKSIQLFIQNYVKKQNKDILTYLTFGPVTHGFLSSDRQYQCTVYFRATKLFCNQGYYLVSEKECCSISNPKKPLPEITSAPKRGETDSAARQIHTILTSCRTSTNTLSDSLQQLHNAWQNILSAITPHDTGSKTAYGVKKYRTLESFFTLAEAEEYLSSLGSEFIAEKSSNTTDNLIIQRIKTFMQDHLNEDLDMHQAAEKAGVSYNYFSTLFKQSTGLTFSEYLLTLRMTEAKKLLENSSLKVSEIAQHVGYTYPKHFTRAFKKHYNVSPKQFISGVR